MGGGVKENEEDEEEIYIKLLSPIAIAAVALAAFLSFILPSFLGFLLLLASGGAAGFHLFREKQKLDESEEGDIVPAFKTYKAKLITYVVGLPDDVAKALSSDEDRKQWDIISILFNEKSDKFVLYRKSPQTFYIYDRRLSRTNKPREIFLELSKIKGKPYFLKMTAYTTVTKEMNEQVGEKGVRNCMNALRNYVATADSVSDLNLSLSNVKGELNNFSGNPTLTITDMIEEIEEVDMGDDGFTEVDDEEGKESISIVEEVKVGSQAAPQQTIPPPVKELSFEEKFEQELQTHPAHIQEVIRKAKKGVNLLIETAENPNWKQIKTKPNNVYSMEAPGGLKCIKGEGIIDYPPKDIAEYLRRENSQMDYDDQVVDGGTVEEYPMNCSCTFIRFKGVMFVSGRDFCLLGITIYYPDGRIILATSSHTHDDCPPHKKYVRAELTIGGWILTPSEDEPGKTYAQYVSQSDLKGKIPKTVVNSVSEKQGLNVSKIGASMVKNF